MHTPTHSLHFRVHTRVLLTLVIACAIATMVWAEPAYRQDLRAAAMAQRAGDFATAAERFALVRSARPDYPRALLGLARSLAQSNQHAAAFAPLDDLAARGLVVELARDPALAPLLADPRAQALQATYRANAAPRGQVGTELTLAQQTGLVENAVRDRAGHWYFADVHHRGVWRLAAGEAVPHRFTAADLALGGVFALAIDETRGALYATSCANEMSAGYDAAREAGRAELLELDLATGALRRRVPLAEPAGEHVLGSLRFGPDGALYATDSVAPIIWRLAPGAERVEVWLRSEEFVSLQGCAFAPDGRTLYVADYANGLWSIDVASRTPTLLRAAPDSCLFGVDDLHWHRDGLVAVQNGVGATRLLRVTVAGPEARARVLAQGQPELADAATGTVSGDQFYFVGHAGWAHFERTKAASAPRSILLLSLPL